MNEQTILQNGIIKIFINISTTNKTVCYVQRSQEFAPRIFPPSPCSEENLHFLEEFRFQYSDITDSDNLHLCKVSLRIKNVMLHIVGIWEKFLRRFALD